MSKISPPEPEQVPHRSRTASYAFQGQNRDGLFVLESPYERVLIFGVLLTKLATAPGSKRVAWAMVKSSPGYVYDKAHKAHPVSTATGERYRVRGIVKAVESLRPQPPLKPKKPELVITHQQPEGTELATNVAADVPSQAPKSVISPAAKKAKQPAHRPSKPERIHAEMLRVETLRSQGSDPTVRIAFAAHYVGESQATLYRKIKVGQFPQGIKREIGVFWHLSLLDAYKEGRWQPENIQP